VRYRHFQFATGCQPLNFGSMETKAIRLWDQDYPASLSGEQWKDPLTVADHFFSSHKLQDVQLLLWQSLPLVFTHQHEQPPEQRYQCLRMLNQLEKLVDATYVLLNYPDRLADRNSHKAIRQSITLNALSFLSMDEARKPAHTIRQIFSTSGPDKWKPRLLRDLRQALFDPCFFISGNSGTLREFDDYLNLNKLLEATFLLSKDQQLTGKDSPHWSLQECLPDPLAWGTKFYTNGGIKNALKALAFIQHYRRWHTEWHAAAGLLLLEHYSLISRLIYLADWLTGTPVSNKNDQTLTLLRQALVKQFERAPVGYHVRFLNRCLLNASGSYFKSGTISSEERKFSLLAKILHLSANYFIHLCNAPHHE